MGDRLMRSIEDSVMVSGVIVADGVIVSDDVICCIDRKSRNQMAQRPDYRVDALESQLCPIPQTVLWSFWLCVVLRCLTETKRAFNEQVLELCKLLGRPTMDLVILAVVRLQLVYSTFIMDSSTRKAVSAL
ncbi:hypothetical protein KIN20_009572 [Parelaphostrongylus tenuis]|uniref:Uncharacterized protein n=1 Tax=Parelaphostrongylus tenuis TaxID=148309 RepID=A0AAD5MQS4_PARTN|nr:hypothetical protein KIN20_009572 [Parelaphostrongylus tenuis]